MQSISPERLVMPCFSSSNAIRFPEHLVTPLQCMIYLSFTPLDHQRGHPNNLLQECQPADQPGDAGGRLAANYQRNCRRAAWCSWGGWCSGAPVGPPVPVGVPVGPPVVVGVPVGVEETPFEAPAGLPAPGRTARGFMPGAPDGMPPVGLATPLDVVHVGVPYGPAGPP
jgi:hypothetical protein